MRIFNLFSLIVMAAVAVFTWSTVAKAGVPERVHILENLSSEELKDAYALIQKKGYEVSHKPLFTDSKETLVITKTIRTESDEPSIQIEMMKKDSASAIPRTTYIIKVPTEHIQDAINEFPPAAQLADWNTMPVAFQPSN